MRLCLCTLVAAGILATMTAMAPAWATGRPDACGGPADTPCDAPGAVRAQAPGHASCVATIWPGLQAYLSGQEGALVFILLSPRMPYALQRWPAMRKVAQRAGFRVVPLRDPRVGLAEWQAAVDVVQQPALACIPALDARSARRLGLLHHAPSSLVAACAQLHPWPILGVMPDTTWRQLLQQRLSWLEEHACPHAWHAG